MGDQAGEGARYRAFISYSHADQAFGRRLHRRLEGYGLPRRLVGRPTARGEVPRRVAPVFRDREEFSAAGDLTAEVRAALAASGALIVVCTPNAAASPWVAREVELFRELHPDRPVLAALAAGEPATAFPPPLTRAGGALVEPLAADFRTAGDGPRLALLKLVAGVLGLGLDELVQRDAQQRLRSVTAVTAGAVAVAVVMSALTTFALLQRADAQRQRGEAEALVEFMLTDLRDRLKGVGRLDVLTSVNERTLKYYAGQDLDRLPAASQARYARILLAMGEDDMLRGDDAGALTKFNAAGRVTRAQLAAVPNDPDRIWAHGQSEYWIGFHAYRQDDRAGAGQSWRRYRELAADLTRRSPFNAKYRRELAYADGNLCTLALKKPPDVTAALSYCARSLSEMETTARLAQGRFPVATDLINRHAWMARAHAANSDLQSALRERLTEERLLKAELDADPRNLRLKQVWIVLQRELAGLEVLLGQRDGPQRRIVAAKREVDQLMAFDPQNKDWAIQGEKLDMALQYFATSHRRDRRRSASGSRECRSNRNRPSQGGISNRRKVVENAQ